MDMKTNNRKETKIKELSYCLHMLSIVQSSTILAKKRYSARSDCHSQCQNSVRSGLNFLWVGTLHNNHEPSC